MKNDGRHCVGYVLENVGDIYWKVKLTTNYILKWFDRDEGTYRYHNSNGITVCVIKCYWPIHILIHASVHGKLTLNRIVHLMDDDYISIVHSS